MRFKDKVAVITAFANGIGRNAGREPDPPPRHYREIHDRIRRRNTDAMLPDKRAG